MHPKAALETALLLLALGGAAFLATKGWSSWKVTKVKRRLPGTDARCSAGTVVVEAPMRRRDRDADRDAFAAAQRFKEEDARRRKVAAAQAAERVQVELRRMRCEEKWSRERIRRPTLFVTWNERSEMECTFWI